jgi:hypothetical protein
MAEYLTQRQLGRKYGVSSHQVGKWLVEWGLRSKDGRPSALAVINGIVKKEECQNKGHFFYRWNEDVIAKYVNGGFKTMFSPSKQRRNP